jgi:cell filamentation protein
MLDGREAQRSRVEGSGEVGLLANRALHLQLDQAVHLDAVLHRQLLDDRLDERLAIRTVVIAKDDLFALPENIVSYLGSVLAKLPAGRHLRGLTREQVIDRLTYYLAEINATHPFREGNGRAQRAFVAQLAADAGYRVDWR